MSRSDMKECDSDGIVRRTRLRRECVDSPLEQVDDDNVSVYMFVRDSALFSFDTPSYRCPSCIYSRDDHRLVRAITECRRVVHARCVLFILESSIPNKMNNIYSPERSIDFSAYAQEENLFRIPK
jgi:hypothetical protein